MSDDDEKKLPPAKQKIADEICKRIGEGESLRAICLGDEMPHNSTIMGWARDFTGFAKQYARAREEQAETHFDEIIEIADDNSYDHKVVDGQVVVDGDAIQRAKLRVDTRKWTTGKMLPKKYGDKLDLTITQEAPPLTIVFNVNAPVGEIRVTKS